MKRFAEIRNAAFTFLLLAGVSSCGLFHKKHSKAAKENSEAQQEIYYQAEAAYTLGNYEEARILFQKFVDQSPKPASGYYRLACLKKLQGKYDEAMDLSAKSIALDPANAFYYEMFQADVYRAKKEYNRAGQIYANWALKTTGRWSLYQDAARMYQMSGSFDRLIILCNQWEKAFNLREDIVNMRVWAYQRKGKKDSVALEYQKLVQKYPERKQYKISWASSLQEAGQTQKAMEVYRELLALDPENGDILNSLCQFYRGNANYKAIWEIAPKIAASHQLNMEQKRNCLSEVLLPGDANPYFDSLEPVLSTLTRLHPEDGISWQLLADWYYRRSYYQNACTNFQYSLQKFSTFQVWKKYTDCLGRLRYYKRMQLAADSMMVRFPSNPQVFEFQANAYYGLKQYQDARTAAESGLSFAVDEQAKLPLNIVLARVLNKLGKKEDAIALLKLPDNKNTYASMLGLAQIYLENESKLDEVQSILDTLMAQLGRDLPEEEWGPEVMMTHADLQIIKGYPNNLEAALGDLGVGTKMNPMNSGIWEKKGDIQTKLGRLGDARVSYETALKLAPGSDELRKKASTGY